MLKKATAGLLVLLALPFLANAQYDPEARKVLDAMSEKYRNISSFSADLTQTLSNAGEGLNETMKGSVSVKGDMFLIKMGPQEIANDGQKVYVYLEEVNEINIDFYYPDDSDITPSKIFDIYKEGYKYIKLPDETVNGKVCHIIDLIPEDDTGGQFYRIRLAVAKNDLMVQRYQMYDRANTVYSFTFSNVKLNANLPNSMFKFDKTTHPNAAIVDLTN